MKIYTIGAGSDSESFFGGLFSIPVNTGLDEESLQALAAETKGNYFRAKDVNSLFQIYNEIDKLEPMTSEGRYVQEVKELYPYAAAMALIAPFFPEIYNTTAEARRLAVRFILAQAVFMPQNAFIHAAYFTLRSGGKTVITFLFDSVYVWCISIPIAFVLSRITSIYVVWILVFVQIGDWIKCIIGFYLVKKGVWIQNIVTNS